MVEPARIIKLIDNWYVETKTGYDGPFETYDEAESFLRLSERADAARVEFAGLAFGAF